MSNYRVKRLGPDDVDAVHGLLDVFGDAFNEPDTYGMARPDDFYFARLLGREQFIMLAATIGQEVVGGLVAYVLDKFEQPRSEIYIYDLAVAEAHRRKGLGTALIEQLRAIGQMLGAYVIFVQADHGDDPAIALYSKLGRREDVLHFDIEI
jgi:aminoglycoside 3-N-acetyltransferase I